MPTDLRLDHVAIAVEDLEAAVSVYSELLDAEAAGRETVESEGVDVAFFDLGETRIELMEPRGPDTPVGRFLERRGPGLHHVALGVPDIESALERCRAAGLEPAGDAPRPGSGGGRVAFLHPRGTSGVLIELSERPG